RSAYVRKDDHVIFGSQIALAEKFIGEISVRNAVMIERRAYPSLVLSPGPGVDVADSRNGHLVGLDRRRRCDRPGGKTELLNLRGQTRAIPIRNNERARAKLSAIQFEILFGRKHFHVLILEAKRHQRVVTGVFHNDGSTGSFQAAWGFGIRGQERHSL